MRAESPLEAKMVRLLWAFDIEGYEREYLFAQPERKWRFDFCFVEQRVALEVDGGQWHYHGGRHNTDSDRWKLNDAAARGYRVLRFSAAMLDEPDRCATLIERALGRESDD